jgi:hypothetical protein
MLFRSAVLEGIQRGEVTLAFRRWRRPSVRAGGTLLTPVGELQIRSVDQIPLAAISASDARRAGYASREALLAELHARPAGEIYRIVLGALRPDPRVALREIAPVTEPDFRALDLRLDRLDARATGGAWTARTLALLKTHPGVRAGDLCGFVGQPKEDFKLNVRKLKNLGLTESLGTGYRLSPRGDAVLRRRPAT